MDINEKKTDGAAQVAREPFTAKQLIEQRINGYRHRIAQLQTIDAMLPTAMTKAQSDAVFDLVLNWR